MDRENTSSQKPSLWPTGLSVIHPSINFSERIHSKRMVLQWSLTSCHAKMRYLERILDWMVGVLFPQTSKSDITKSDAGTSMVVLWFIENSTIFKYGICEFWLFQLPLATTCIDSILVNNSLATTLRLLIPTDFVLVSCLDRHQA